MRRVGLGILAALIAAAAAGGAAAESCDPTAIIDAYRQAEASYQAQDVAAAAAQFRPLAEQGLGPAQLRLGEIIESGDKPDLMQAYRGIALAADVHAPGAEAALTKLTKRISPAQIAMQDFTPRTWRPERLWSCLAADPHVTRPDGTRDYDFERVINHRPVATPTTQPAQLAWLAASLDTIRTQHPRYLIYLKALDGIGLMDGPGRFVIAGARNQLPFVRLNQSYMGKVSAKDPAQLLAAVVTSVHAALVPQAFVDARTRTPVIETYKGYRIQTLNDRNGQAFIGFAKAAIDMTVMLPPDLLKLARSLTDIRYEPYVAGDGRPGTLTFGRFVRDPKTGQGYESFMDNRDGRGPGWMAVALASGGLYLHRSVTGERLTGSDATHGDCEMDRVEIRSMEALHLSEFDIKRAQDGSARRGCDVVRFPR